MELDYDPYAPMGQPAAPSPEEHADEAAPPADDAAPLTEAAPAPLGPLDPRVHARTNVLPDVTLASDWEEAYIRLREFALAQTDNVTALRAKVLRLEAELVPHRPTPPDFSIAEQPPKRSQLPPTPSTPKE